MHAALLARARAQCPRMIALDEAFVGIGDQLIDAAAGYSDNNALVTELLGLRPARHAPLGTDATLYSAPPEPDPDPGDEEVEPL